MTVDDRTLSPGAEPGAGMAGGGQIVVPPTVTPSRRQRRPSGAPPPLPRSIGRTGISWLVGIGLLLTWIVVASLSPAVRRLTNQADAAILRQIARVRTGWLTDVMSAVSRVGSGWVVAGLAMLLVVALAVLRRWRHLFTFIGSVAVLELIASALYDGFARPRPFDVTTIGRWAGYTMPDGPVLVVSMVGLGIAYTLVVAGKPRTIAKAVAAGAVGVFAASQLYLATYHPFDVVVGIALSGAIIINAFRFFTPNEVFPVTYRRAKTAHLDVGGRRGEALRQAVHDQLGLTVLDIKPVGLEGSGGSTPLRLRVAGEPDTYLFGKLYAMSHVRADRWYKLGRTILYGRLEDEMPFQSVRRLVEYEDYAARLLRDVGIPTATPYGIVEITPEREYLLLTEFFDGAVEIGEAPVDDGVIDEALLLVRRLWDSGLAHRDIKPANLLVRDGHVLVIDVFFVQVRPSPWRQAVDLANMMLVLGVRTDPQRVYDRALQFFTPDEIAEAFAAARGVASPTQLRTVLKEDGRDLLRQFRALAPQRRPIALQRWSIRRVVLALTVLAVGFLAVNATVSLLVPAYDVRLSGSPTCGTGSVMVLMAQSVPDATRAPCVAALPVGWSVGGLRIHRHEARFWLSSDAAGHRAVEVSLAPPGECSVADATEVPSDEEGARRFEQPAELPPNLRTTRYYVFPGGCVTYEFAIDGPNAAALVFEADAALAFQPREPLVEKVRHDTGLSLCGSGAPACVGGP